MAWRRCRGSTVTSSISQRKATSDGTKPGGRGSAMARARGQSRGDARRRDWSEVAGEQARGPPPRAVANPRLLLTCPPSKSTATAAAAVILQRNSATRTRSPGIRPALRPCGPPPPLATPGVPNPIRTRPLACPCRLPTTSSDLCHRLVASVLPARLPGPSPAHPARLFSPPDAPRLPTGGRRPPPSKGGIKPPALDVGSSSPGTSGHGPLCPHTVARLCPHPPIHAGLSPTPGPRRLESLGQPWLLLGVDGSPNWRLGTL